MKFKSERERLRHCLRQERAHLPWPSSNAELHAMIADGEAKIMRMYEAPIGRGKVGPVAEISLVAAKCA